MKPERLRKVAQICKVWETGETDCWLKTTKAGGKKGGNFWESGMVTAAASNPWSL